MAQPWTIEDEHESPTRAPGLGEGSDGSALRLHAGGEGPDPQTKCRIGGQGATPDDASAAGGLRRNDMSSAGSSQIAPLVHVYGDGTSDLSA